VGFFLLLCIEPRNCSRGSAPPPRGLLLPINHRVPRGSAWVKASRSTEYGNFLGKRKSMGDSLIRARVYNKPTHRQRRCRRRRLSSGVSLFAYFPLWHCRKSKTSWSLFRSTAEGPRHKKIRSFFVQAPSGGWPQAPQQTAFFSSRGNRSDAMIKSIMV